MTEAGWTATVRDKARKLYGLLHAEVSRDHVCGAEDVKAIRKMEVVDIGLLIAALDDSYQQGRVAGLREAVAKLGEKREETEKEWQEDTTVPKGEHDEADCDGACDLYAVVISTLINLATQLEQLYDAQAAQDEKEVGDANTKG